MSLKLYVNNILRRICVGDIMVENHHWRDDSYFGDLMTIFWK